MPIDFEQQNKDLQNYLNSFKSAKLARKISKQNEFKVELEHMQTTIEDYTTVLKRLSAHVFEKIDEAANSGKFWITVAVKSMLKNDAEVRAFNAVRVGLVRMLEDLDYIVSYNTKEGNLSVRWDI